MLVHQEDRLTIVFGDACHAVQVPYTQGIIDDMRTTLLNGVPSIALQRLVFVRQVHGTRGFLVNRSSLTDDLCNREGDFLATDLTGIGIGVLTADCLPMVIYDTRSKAVAVVHAGWRGTVQGVAASAFHAMQATWGTSPAEVRVFFGPCAKSCCYAVGPAVIDKAQASSYTSKALVKRDHQTFFDLALSNQGHLEALGIPSDAFVDTYHRCTIERDEFCSYRRNPTSANRNYTIVVMQ